MRRFRRYPSSSVWICVVACIVVVGRYFWDRGSSAVPHAAEGSSLSGNLIAGEFEVVRLERANLLLVRQSVPVLGRDRPLPLEAPLQLLGVKSRGLTEEGRQFTSEFLRRGVPSLELDRRRLDSAGHFLAYVYVDGKLLNEELIRAGLAQADLYPGDNQSMHRNLVKAEREARQARRGIWAEPTSDKP